MIITGGMTFSGGFNLAGQSVYYYQPETYSNSTVLLVQADKTFYYDDTSVFNNIITAPNLTSATSFVPSSFTSISPSDGSGSFPGTGRLSVTANTALQFGTGDFTLEAWIYLDTAATGVSYRIFTNWASNSESYQFYLRTNNRLVWQSFGSASPDVAALQITPFTWTHVAFCRSGTTVTTFINGALANTVTGVTNSLNGVGTPTIGSDSGGGNYFIGYISNLRIIHGRALYTGAFTVPTQALTLSPTPLDASNYSFDLAASSYVSTPSNVNIVYGTADFTIECWFRLTNATSSYRGIWAQNNTVLRFGDAGFGDKLQFAVDQSSVANIWSCAVTASSVLNTWTHVAWTRSNGANRLYVNGVLQSIGSGSNPASYPSTSFTGAGSITSGGVIGNLFVGQISNVRITNGYVVYSGNFTPPTNRLTTTQSTGTNNIFPITSSVQPYSVSFNGSSQYLKTQAFDAGCTGDFTFECWAYIVTYGATSAFFTIGDEAAGRYYFALTASGGQLWSNQYGGANFTWGTATSVLLNRWTHIAWVRVGTTVTGYVNGISVGTQTISGTVGNSGGITIGANPAGGYLWTGYLSNVRIVARLAVYTGNFTPPTNRLTATQSTGTNISAIGILVANYSVLFNGTSQYLSANNAALALGTGNFTVEAWIYTTVSSGTQCVYDTRQNDGTTTGFYFGLLASNTLLFWTGGAITINAGTVPANTWSHIALVRVGNTFTIYLNGTSVGTATNSNNFTNTIVQIGSSSNVTNSTANYYTGYISNLRVVNRLAVYTGSFTPPTSRLTVTQSAGTNIAAITTSIVNYSVSLNGSSQYLSVPANAVFAFGTGDFTVEAWVNSSVAPGANLPIAQSDPVGSSTNNKWWFAFAGTGLFFGTHSSGGFSVVTTTAFSAGTWYHVAVTRASGVMRMFINGVSTAFVTSGTPSGYSLSQNGITIGAMSTPSYWNGYISNLRVISGTALYTANFAVPTTALPVVAGTALLTLQSATFVDNSVNAYTITPTGSPAISTINPFGGSVVLLTAQDPVIQDNSALASSITNTGAATTSTQNPFGGGSTVLLTAQDPVIQDNSALASTITNTGAATTSTQNPFGSTALLTAQDSVIRDNSSNAVTLTTTGGPGVSPLTPFGVTALLTLQSNAGDDNSNIENFARIQSTSTLVNRVGTVTPGSFSPFSPTVWSNYFNTGDKLTFPSSSAFDLSGSTWTIEFWMYSLTTVTSGNNLRLLMGGANGDAAGWTIGYGNDGAIGFGRPYSGSPTAIYTPAGAIALNTWYHVAIVCNAGSARIYINGTQAAGPVTISLPTSASQALRIGYDDVGTVNFQYNGYLSNLRIVKDRAIYTGNFTPPNSRLSTSQSAGTNITSIKTTIDYSVSLNGSSQYLTAPVASANFSTNNFTIELWAYFLSNTGGYKPVLGSNGSGDSQGWIIITETGNQLTFYSSNGSAWSYNIVSSYIPTPNAWTHIAVCRVSTTITLYANGVSIGTAAIGANTNGVNGTVLNIGYYPYFPGGARFFSGYMSNVRLVNGTALYTANFTVPTDALPVVAGTSLLALKSATFIDNSVNAYTITPVSSPAISTVNPFGGTTVLLTCQSNRFVDNSINALAPTVTGTPAIAPFSPLPQTDSYNASVHGSSLYFSGSSSYLNFTQEPNLYQFAGDFTIEAWVYSLSATGQVNYSGIFDTRAANTPSTTGIVVNLTPTGYLNFYINSNNYTSATLLGANNWTHVALVRNGSTISMYQNGVSVALVSYATSLSSGNFWVGTLAAAGTGGFWQGYISDLRAINGVAVYTSAFTPPTLPLSTTAQTVVLLNGNSAGIIDSTGKNNLITMGGAKLNHAVFKYGTGSIAFNGTTDYLKLRVNDPTLTFGSGDFTIEAWVYLTSISGTQYLVVGTCDNSTVAGSSFDFFLIGAGGANIYIGATAYQAAAPTPTLNTWCHVAYVRYGTSFKTYLNGVQVGSVTLPAGGVINAGTTYPGAIGANGVGSSPMVGYMDDLRISRIARYTANFTAPTALLSTGTYIQIA